MYTQTLSMSRIKASFALLAAMVLLLATLLAPSTRVLATNGDITIINEDSLKATQEIDLYVDDLLEFTVEGYEESTMDIVVSRYNSPSVTEKTAMTTNISLAVNDRFQLPLSVVETATANTNFTAGLYVVQVLDASDENTVLASADFKVHVMNTAEEQEEDETPVLSTNASCGASVDGFEDADGHWAEFYITQLAKIGAVSGKAEAKFEPNSVLTRAEGTKIVLCSQGYEVVEKMENAFPDIQGSWAVSIINTAKSLGIIAGHSDGTFKPNLPMTRAEILVVLLNAKHADLTTSPAAPFSDVDQNSYYAGAVNFAYDNNIVVGYGDGTFRPHGNVTRGEMAKMAFLVMSEL